MNFHRVLFAGVCCAACASTPAPKQSAAATVVRNTTTVEMYPAEETRPLRLAEEDRALSTPPSSSTSATRSSELGAPTASSDGLDRRQIFFDDPQSESDMRISEAIRQALRDDTSLSLNAQNSRIECVDGKVTLRGSVQSRRESSAVEAAARRVSGVETVDNQLEIH